MTPDPLWRQIADRRYAITWWHDDIVPSTSYTPPAVTSDYMPKGTFARHPVVGDVYQWLLKRNDRTMFTAGSPDLNPLIDGVLKNGLATHDTTLYSPISVI